MSLQNVAVLVRLNISQWTARKYDRRVTQEVSDSHGTVGEVGRYNKVLLPMSDLLGDIHRKATKVRTEYYANTLGWDTDGIQLLPSANYMDYVEMFNEHKAEWNVLVDKFVTDYPQLKLDAERLLNSMYNEADYPEAYEIRDKFGMDLTVMPVPSTDFRVEIGDEELERINAEAKRTVEVAYKASMKEVWQRLYDKVETMNAKLSDETAVFRDTLVENVREICEIVPRMNFDNDPDLAHICQQVDTLLANNHPDALRNDPIKRRQKASESKDILNKMSVFMEGK